MLNRATDVVKTPNRVELPPLPAVDWSRVSQHAPTPTPLGPTKPDAALPRADVVVITWTSAEWSALDHVFVSPDVRVVEVRAIRSGIARHASDHRPIVAELLLPA